MDKPKILWGICGIGSGHTNRQRPLIEHFSQRARMVIFGHGNSLEHYSERFADDENVLVQPVAVPFYVGNKDGLDFTATAQAPENQGIDFFGINSTAFSEAQKFLGKPDLVISDYEPNSADYGNAYLSPVVTFDQQSKYFVGDFPEELNGTYYKDEIARLSMMFRHAEARLACSFFKVPRREDAKEKVKIYPALLKGWLYDLKRQVSQDTKSILVYLTKQKGFEQTMAEVKAICSSQRDTLFHVFAPEANKMEKVSPNTTIYPHGHSSFRKVLAECNGIISTAGHTLLAEAMHLNIPVYAMPLGLYEQQMNAHVIEHNGFGLSHPRLEASKLAEFVEGLEESAKRIREDTEVLLRGSGETEIIDFLEREFL